MGRRDEVWMAEQRVGRRRLLDEDIEGRARNMTAVERRAQCSLVDKAAAGAIDDANARLGLRQIFRREDVARLRRQGRVEGDEIGARQEIVEFELFDAELLGALCAQERIEGDDPHLQSERARGDDRADIPATNDAERLAGQLDAHEAVLFPLARLGRDVGARDLPSEREHQCDRMLGGGDRIAERRVHHDHAASGGGRNVDVVDADARAADDFQFRRALEQLGCDFGVGANGEPVIVANDLGELLFVETRFDVDLDAALLEDRDGGGGKLIGNENTGVMADVLEWRP